MQLTKTDIRKIILKAVQRYPTLICGGVNSFASIQSMADLKDIDTSNAKKIYDDYLKNLFWSRTWDLTGANPNTLKREFPTLATIFTNSSILHLSHNCVTVTLALLDSEDCRDCTDICKRPSEIIADDCETTLVNILQYLATFKKFAIEMPNGATIETWDTAGYIQESITIGDIVSASVINEIANHIDFNMRFDISPFNVENTQGLIGKTVRLTFCGCQLDNISFATQMPKINRIGTTHCSTCL